MTPFARVLVPVDFSEVTPAVVAMARRLLAPDGRAVLLHVVETLPLVTEAALGLYPHRREMEEFKRLSTEKLGQMVADLKDPRLVPAVREGKPAHEIAQVAADVGAEVIVIGTHGRSGLEHLLVGSVTERVLRRARCHVFTVRV
jgi:universal stress protein A